MAETYNATHKTLANRFEVDEFVKRLRKRMPSVMIPKLATRWEGPFIVHTVGPHDSYVLKKPNGELEPHPVNANHLAPFIGVSDLNVTRLSQSSPSSVIMLKSRFSLLDTVAFYLFLVSSGKADVLSISDCLLNYQSIRSI
jgi:hypothetical protein